MSLQLLGNGVGIGSEIPAAKLDVSRQARIQSSYELPVTVTSSSNVVGVAITLGNTFLHTTTENVTKFEFTGAPSGSAASFTIKIIQGATPRTVAVDNLKPMVE